jgi:hypothetical protein
MAKKRQRKTPAKLPSAVQFRAGATLESILDQLTAQWQLDSKHETARRLACLAGFDFGQRHHDLINELMERRYGRTDFVEAAHEVYIHLEAVDVERCRRRKQPMPPEERDCEIEQYVRNYVLMHRSPEEPEKRKEQVRVQRTD